MKTITEAIIYKMEVGTEIYFNDDKHPDIFQGIIAEDDQAFIKNYASNQTEIYDFCFIVDNYKIQ
jgi:hypothetical protein